MTDENAKSVDHSIFNPAFAKLNDIKHAQTCQNQSCTIPNCMETKCLLDHVYKCSELQFMELDDPQLTWECTYPDCDLARVLLDHSQDLPHILPGCPICKKQEVLRRLIPCKGPRADDSDDEEPDVKRRKVEELDTDEQDSKLIKSMRLAMKPRRNIQLKENPKKTEMQRLLHSNMCRKSSCPISHCAYYKGLLHHINACKKDDVCMYPGCVEAINLLDHNRECRPILRPCAECGKQPPPAYTGEDLLSNVPMAVAREIFKHLRMDNWSIKSLERVNRSFREFLRDEKELRGLYDKKVYDELTIFQVSNNRVGVHFYDYKIRNAGHAFIFSTDQQCPVEVIHYNTRHSQTAQRYLKQTYPEPPCSAEPIRIPEELYCELSLALLRYDFKDLELRSIIIDIDFLSFFSDRVDDVFPVERKLSYFNVRAESDSDMDEWEMQCFLDVLDIRELDHDCLEGEARKRDCHGLLLTLPTCDCVAFPVSERLQPTKRSFLDEPYFACSQSLKEIQHGALIRNAQCPCAGKYDKRPNWRS